MSKLFLLLSSVSGALAVAIGAFGAHGLQSFLEKNNRQETFETAVKYHFYHTLALFGLSIIMMHTQHKLLDWSGYMFTAGIIIFSGSLYLLCFLNQPKLGAITPIGGVALIAGWVLMAIGAVKSL